MLRIDPALPTLRIEAKLPTLRSEAALAALSRLKALKTDHGLRKLRILRTSKSPGVREASRKLCAGPASDQGPSPGIHRNAMLLIPVY